MLIITGPRQVGKATLLRELVCQTQRPALWLNCDEPDDRAALENVSSTQLKVLEEPTNSCSLTKRSGCRALA